MGEEGVRNEEESEIEMAFRLVDSKGFEYV